MTEEAPKHPYVTPENARVHLIMSIIMSIFSFIQVILGIVFSEKIVKEVEWYMSGEVTSYGDMSYENYFYGDHLWIGFVGIILAALGFSTWKTRSRSNGIMLSIMLFISAFCIYPVAALLGKLPSMWNYNSAYGYEIETFRTGSSIYIGIQALFICGWAFYTAFHACCNSKVRKQRQIAMPGGGTATVQAPVGQQVVYVQQPVAAPGYVQQPGGYVQQPGGYVQQPVFIASAAPPDYSPQTQGAGGPAMTVPAQVHAPLPNTPGMHMHGRDAELHTALLNDYASDCN